ncbi:MAG: hypothetical protein HQL35_14485 [Alphaproteobacteria bacterium]|nr:hypothetical protein [Alphaproteobacteria bacterium]
MGSSSPSDAKRHAFDLMIESVKVMISVNSILGATLIGYMKILGVGSASTPVQCSFLGGISALFLVLNVLSCLYLFGVSINLAHRGHVDVYNKTVRWVYAISLISMGLGITAGLLFAYLNAY